MEIYPDGGYGALRGAIARRYGLNPDRIVCGNGSDELFHLLAQAFMGQGDEAIHTEHGFAVYRIATQAAGGTPVEVPETNFTTDVDAILAAVTGRTRMVFIANPNNPTGTYIPINEVRRLHAGLPSNVLLVLDGAYAEYVTRNDYEAGIELVSGATNAVMTRTFSKVHGLAAFARRLGLCARKCGGCAQPGAGAVQCGRAVAGSGNRCHRRYGACGCVRCTQRKVAGPAHENPAGAWH